MSLCKAHGKERDTICHSKPSGKGGRVFEYVGCVDCKAGAPPRSSPLEKSPAKTKAKSNGSPSSSAKKFEPSPHTIAKPKTDEAPAAPKKGASRGFLGFRF